MISAPATIAPIVAAFPPVGGRVGIGVDVATNSTGVGVGVFVGVTSGGRVGVGVEVITVVGVGVVVTVGVGVGELVGVGVGDFVGLGDNVGVEDGMEQFTVSESLSPTPQTFSAKTSQV